MTALLKTPIGRFRIVSFLEGLSFLILLFIAMPLKYIWDKPEMVRAFGMAHGALFVLFIFMALTLSVQKEWKFFKTTWLVLASSIVPFGMLYIDAKILKKIK